MGKITGFLEYERLAEAMVSFQAALRDSALAKGEAVQYPMIAVTIGNVLQSDPKLVNDIGVFPIPADNASDTRLTIWEPGGAYIPKSTTGQKLIAAKKFVAWLNSPDGCAIQNKTGLPSGPYAIRRTVYGFRSASASL